MSGEPAPLWIAAFNTSLIVISGVFLALGYGLIRRKRIAWHRRSMLTATTFAALFLVVYVTRALIFEAKLFAGEGLGRAAYLAILGSHTIVAIGIVPLVLVTLYRAWRAQFDRHRGIARVALPLWGYVVVTGWIIFWALYLA